MKQKAQDQSSHLVFPASEERYLGRGIVLNGSDKMNWRTCLRRVTDIKGECDQIRVRRSAMEPRVYHTKFGIRIKAAWKGLRLKSIPLAQLKKRSK